MSSQVALWPELDCVPHAHRNYLRATQSALVTGPCYPAANVTVAVLLECRVG